MQVSVLFFFLSLLFLSYVIYHTPPRHTRGGADSALQSLKRLTETPANADYYEANDQKDYTGKDQRPAYNGNWNRTARDGTIYTDITMHSLIAVPYMSN